MDEKGVSAVSGTVGHRSEMVACQATNATILPTEAGRSDVSKKLVRKDLLCTWEKSPGRCGTKDEIVVCAITGKQLLADEVATSAVSGKSCDKELLRESECSGRLAMPDELVSCEETGIRLLPAEA